MTNANPTSPFRYYAYGLVIHSDIQLPELQGCDATEPDLIYLRRELPFELPAPGEGDYSFGKGQADIAIGGIGRFWVRSAELVEFSIAADAEMSHVSLVMLGSVLATVLQLRGLLTLHASGVAVNGRGVAFLGDKGAGKSSTAAAFVRAGHQLLTDDILPIDLWANGARILPGFPQMKLCDAAAEAIALPDATTSRIARMNYVKTRLRLADRFMADPVPASTLYVLARTSTLSIQPISGPEALMALMRNVYHARFGNKVFYGAASGKLLGLCGTLLAHATVKLLHVPADLDRLGEIVSLVERDIG